MLFNKPLLTAALAKRESLRKKTNALRLVNGRGDGLDGLVIEQYKNHFVIQIFNPLWLKELLKIQEFLGMNFKVDYLIAKDRTQSSSSKPEAINFKELLPGAASRTIVLEHGLQFEVDLNDTLNTGLFLDMRSNRQLVGQACGNARVLNFFAYTCSFGVYARANRAKDVVNVDVSKKILEKGQRNYVLNDIQAAGNEFIKTDAVLYLEKALKKDNRFDVIILDPPSFSRAGSKSFSVERDFAQLIKQSCGILTPHGKILIATNLSEMSFTKLEQILRDNAESFKKVTRLGQDQDFVGSGQAKESHLVALWAERSS